jgi:NAD+ synthase (glutamine-hydrolysing)
MIISLAQFTFSNANIESNFNKIIQNLDNFYNSDIIIFPELFLSGYIPSDLLLISEFKKIINFKINNLKNIILKKGFKDKIFILGSPFYKNNKIYNSAFIFYKNKIFAYNKIFLPNYGVFDEKRYFISGSSFIIFKINYNKKLYNLSLLICEDIWDNFTPVYYLKYKYNIFGFIVINASPFEVNKQKKRYDLLINKAKEISAFFVYVNTVGLYDDVLFDGNSFIVDNLGNIVYNLEPFNEEIFHFDLSNYINNLHNTKAFINIEKKIDNKKSYRNTLKKIFKSSLNSYLKFYKSFKKQIIKLNLKNKINFKGNQIFYKQEKTKIIKEKDELIYKALIFGIKEYFRNTGFSSTVIGVSGGIDSAVCLVLLKHSINNVIPIIMPTKFNKESSIKDAINLCKNLNLNYFIVNIDEFYFKLRESLIKEFGFNADFNLADENLQSRIRAIILMYYANKNNSLVVGTSNKSEVSVGYSTLYGDSIGAIAPLKDLYKFQVYSLANYINKTFNNVIPREIILKEPSAELRDNQKDEDDIPPYHILDKILYYHLEKKFSFKQIKNKLKEENIDITKNLYLDTIKRIYINEYKRYQTPVGFKISEFSFTKERRVPIINSFYKDLSQNIQHTLL